MYSYHYNPTENISIKYSKIPSLSGRRKGGITTPSSQSKPYLTVLGVTFCLHYILALWSSIDGSRMPLCQSTSGDMYGVKPNSRGWKDVSDNIKGTGCSTAPIRQLTTVCHYNPRGSLWGSFGHQVCMWYTDIHTSKRPIHINK